MPSIAREEATDPRLRPQVANHPTLEQVERRRADLNSKQAAIQISEGFNVGYCRAKPGNGPEPETEHILLFIIGGDAPQAEFTRQANAAIEEWRAEVS